jgi:Asp-tRNA(Asn)/Glu-tRNA(Gln) amidotransferase A subunit family amidase
LQIELWTPKPKALDELTNKSACALAAMIRSREVSPVEVVEAHLRRIEALNPRLNAIVTLAPDAIERAREAEAMLMRGDLKGALHGVPLTIKDTIDTLGLRTTCGSALYAGRVPAVDATAVARLRAAGAIVLGKTNTAEMALTYEASNPLFGRTSNPHDLRLTAGGSSGGEAAAISACLTPAGLGSDLMGSIRVPAHFCGIFGLKPTAARVSTSGHTPPATGALSLGAVVGPLARHVEDLSLLLHAMTGMNSTEYAYAPPAQRDERAIDKLRGSRVAWYVFDGVSPVNEEMTTAVQRAARALDEAGLIAVEQRPPGIERGPQLWSALFSRAAFNYLRRAYDGKENLAGPDARFLLSAAVGADAPTLDDYLAAWNERDYLLGELMSWMDRTPLIIAPVGACEAFEHGARKVRVGEQPVSIFRAFGYSQTYNVYGLPVVSVPAGRTRAGLPVGVQIIGKPFAEETVLAAASIVEAALGGWLPPPTQMLSA